jgi:hypothetical protein
MVLPRVLISSIVRRLAWATAVASAAVGVGIAALAWHGRSDADLWHAVTPSWWAFGFASPRSARVGWWRRADYDPPLGPRRWRVGRFAADYHPLTPREERDDLLIEIRYARGYHHWLGFGYLYCDAASRNSPYRSFVEAWAPTWAVLTVTMSPSLVFVTAAVVRRRRAAQAGQFGRCRGCGDDLRATPDRCPECGVAAVQP